MLFSAYSCRLSVLHLCMLFFIIFYDRNGCKMKIPEMVNKHLGVTDVQLVLSSQTFHLEDRHYPQSQ